jgi:hypothetical protein
MLTTPGLKKRNANKVNAHGVFSALSASRRIISSGVTIRGSVGCEGGVLDPNQVIYPVLETPLIPYNQCTVLLNPSRIIVVKQGCHVFALTCLPSTHPENAYFQAGMFAYSLRLLCTVHRTCLNARTPMTNKSHPPSPSKKML